MATEEPKLPETAPETEEAKPAEAKPAEAKPDPAKPASAKVEVPFAPTGEALVKELKRQVEYYFSEKSYPRDKFMNEKAAEDPEGYIPISILCTFNNMKKILPSGDVAQVVDALKASTTVQTSDDGLKMRRHPDSLKKVIGGRTFYTRSELVEFTRAVIKRGQQAVRAPRAGPRASTCALTPRALRPHLLSAPAQDLVPDDESFVRELFKLHERYAEKVGAGFKSIKVGPSTDHPDSNCFLLVREDGSTDDFSYLKCVAAVFPEPPEDKKKRATRSDTAGERATKRQATGETPGAAPAVAEREFEYTSGLVVIVEGATVGGERVKDVRAEMDKFGPCKFVELVEEQPLLYARFSDLAGAQKALAELKEFEGQAVKVSLMEGAEEKEYYAKIQSKSKERSAYGGRGGGRGGRGSRGRGGGRHGGGGRGGGRHSGNKRPRS